MNGWYLDDNGHYLRFRGKDGFPWFVGNLHGAGIMSIGEVEDDKAMREQIVKVLNQELPDGKPRSRKRKAGTK